MECSGKEVLRLSVKNWRLKFPAQPLVFCFSEVSALCGAVVRLYSLVPCTAASLSVYRGRYYLAVHAGLRKRRLVFLIAGEFGEYLGPARVLYSYYAEHGRELSRNAVAELGSALNREK